MEATLLNHNFCYGIKLQDFNNNTHTIKIETNKPLEVNNKEAIREILLDYIQDVKWECKSGTDASKLSFLNEYREVGDFYLYIDNVIDEPLYKVVDSLIRLKEIEAEYISYRELFEILLTLCFKNFK